MPHAASCRLYYTYPVLAAEGITGVMYLDDLIVVSPDMESASLSYQHVKSLLHELGLPEAAEKAQPPAMAVRWLGIYIDSCEMSLSIRTDKVQDILQYVNKCIAAVSIHKKQLQSLIGRLMHMAKCLEPARIFMARLIAALRDMKDSHFTKVTNSMRVDLEWFAQFAAAWNGKGIIPLAPQPDPYRLTRVSPVLEPRTVSEHMQVPLPQTTTLWPI